MSLQVFFTYVITLVTYAWSLLGCVHFDFNGTTVYPLKLLLYLMCIEVIFGLLRRINFVSDGETDGERTARRQVRATSRKDKSLSGSWGKPEGF